MREVWREEQEILTRAAWIAAQRGRWNTARFLHGLGLRSLDPVQNYAERVKMVLKCQDLPGARAGVRMLALGGWVVEHLDTVEGRRFLDELASTPGANAEVRAVAEELKRELAAAVASRERPKPPEKTQTPKPSMGPVRVSFRQVRLQSPERAMFANRPMSMGGCLPAGDGIDAFWSGGIVWLMKTKGQLKTIWRTPFPNTWILSAFYDGRYLWLTARPDKEAPLIVVIDPKSEQTWTLTEKDGLPLVGPKDVPAPFAEHRVQGSPLGPGKVCLAGGFGRGWVALVTFDPAGHHKVNVILEAKTVPKGNDREQWKKTDVAFMPRAMYTLSDGPLENAETNRRVLIVRKSSNYFLGEHPLVVDPRGPSVEALQERWWPPHMSEPGLEPVHCVGVYQGALYWVAPLGSDWKRIHLNRLALPDLKPTLLVQDAPEGWVVFLGDRLNVLSKVWWTMKVSERKLISGGDVPWYFEYSFGASPKDDHVWGREEFRLDALGQSNHYGLLLQCRNSKGDSKLLQAVLTDPASPATPEDTSEIAAKQAPAQGPRTWTDRSGKYRIEGTLEGFSDDKVQLRRSDGKTIAVELDRLSEADQQVVRQRMITSLPPGAIAEQAAPPTEEADESEEMRVPAERPVPENASPQVKALFLMQEMEASTRAFHLRGNQQDFDRVERLFQRLRRDRAVMTNGDIPLDMAYMFLTCPDNADEKGWQAHFARLERWKKARPNLATPLILEGHSYLFYAGELRGHSPAAKLPEQDAKQFHDRLAKARASLEAAAKLIQDDPTIYRHLLNIARAEGAPRSEAEKWFQKGTAVDLKYYSLYEGMALYLLPRYQGKPGEVEAFALAQADKLGGDAGTDVYLRIALRADIDDPQTLKNFSWERLKQAVPLIAKRYPHSPLYLNLVCRAACVAGDRAQAATLFRTIRNMRAEQLWESLEEFEKYQRWSSPSEVARTEETRTLGKNRVLSHGQSVTCVAYSPDGKLLASTSDRALHPLLLWRSDGRPVNGFRENGPGMTTVAFSRDGAWMATGCAQGEVLVWSVEAMRPVATLRAGEQPISLVEFSPDGKRLLTYGHDRVFRIWDLGTKAERLRHEERNNLFDTIRFSPDGKQLLLNNGAFLECRDAGTGELVYKTQTIRQILGFRPDGTLIGVANNGQRSLVAWDLVKQSSRQLLKETSGLPIALSPDGNRVVFVQGSAQPNDPDPVQRLSVWDVPAGREVASFDAHRLRIMTVAFSPDGKALASCSLDGTVRLWALDDNGKGE